jgi:hypothetical protein
MDFIMPVSATAKLLHLLRWALVLISTAVSAESFTIESAQVLPIGNGFVLNATIKYPLTPRIKEAIDNGVPIIIFQQFEIIESLSLLGGYWQWNETLWVSAIHYQLRYHALTELYILVDMDTRHQRNYTSLSVALEALGTIKQLGLPPEYLTNTDKLILRVRSGLDLNALPTPMRPGALISSKWQLTSPWVVAKWL